MSEIRIRPSRPEDEPAIWEIFSRVVAGGDTYVFPQDSSPELFRAHWIAHKPFVAEIDGEIVGTCIIKPVQMGLGSHISNGSYMVHPDHHGKGIGRALGEFSLKHSREEGYRAIQFNIVVSTNEAAVSLWTKLGFRIIGRCPGAFKHATRGYVDTLVMYQEL